METFNIENRRYLGSKQQLLSFINEIIDRHTNDCQIFADIFAGTAVVANHFNKKYKILVNDTLKCNYHSYICFLSNLPYEKKKIKSIIADYNGIKTADKNYYSDNFSDTYISKNNAKLIGFIRDDIDTKFIKKQINKKEYSILITSLIYAIDKIANTVGHYDAYCKNGKLDKQLLLKFPIIDDNFNKNNEIYCDDANVLIKRIKADIVYLDPPYNSRQYCDTYHFLENIAQNKKPQVLGIARKMDRTNLKSFYCLSNANLHFKELIENLEAKYILFSYNNTSSANARSNIRISDDNIIKILNEKGMLSIFEKDFMPFSAGKSKIKNHKERIFLCKVNQSKQICLKPEKQNKKKIAQSPLNYTGGKFKLIEEIYKILPKDIDNFYDVFCGGFNVGSNIDVKSIIAIDNDSKLIELLKFIQNSNKLEDHIDEIINKYGLSNSSKFGYEYYNSTSANGLGNYNKDKFKQLRDDYNKNKNSLLFLILIIFGFNNQIRFNVRNEFNLPVGKRDFNIKLRKKLKQFIFNIQNSKFICTDFRDIKIDKIKQNSFFYFDPPYLLADATYNKLWNESDEQDLLEFLTILDKKGIKFALSNVLEHKENYNKILLEWCLKFGFNIHHLNRNYANSSYQFKYKNSISKEVLITNY